MVLVEPMAEAVPPEKHVAFLADMWAFGKLLASRLRRTRGDRERVVFTPADLVHRFGLEEGWLCLTNHLCRLIRFAGGLLWRI